MTDTQTKEYQTVILAALLHDVGKFMQRDKDVKSDDTHEFLSRKFIEDYENTLKYDDWYDLEVVKELTFCHARPYKESEFFNKLTNAGKREFKRLSAVVRASDSYSCKERNLEQQRRDHGRDVAPLDSIFSQINLQQKNAKNEKPFYRYHIASINPIDSFPGEFKKLDEGEISKQVSKFKNDFEKLPKFERFEDLLNALLSLLEKHTWCIPGDTRYEISDVSLYDHLRTTCAIAACLYKYRIENRKGREKFVLIGGDFSGIQDYIYGIGSEGAAKRLRARSFFVTIFVEATIHKILDRLNLPITCNLFSAGGKFLLLAPNLDNIKNELNDLKAEIEDEIHKTFFNQFTFTLAWISSGGYKKLKNEKKYFGIHDFFEVADEMFHELEIQKLKRSASILIDKETGDWQVEKFKATELYKSYKGKDCNVCGKGPAVCPDKKPEELEICPICYQDKFIIGQKLPKVQYIGFSRSKVLDDSIRIYDNYYVTLLLEKVSANDFYLLYKIGNNASDDKQEDFILRHYIANHVPTKGDRKEIETFEDIAKYSVWKEEEGKKVGSELLGILKADLDNLGLIFSRGFEDDEKRTGKTISRYLTLSRMIDLFFSGWMKEIMERNDKNWLTSRLSELEGIDKALLKEYLGGIDLSKIYTVYSGGDDLVLVGPWETMIIFSLFLNMEFRRFTCCNNNITLSAGLTVVKPKHPIAAGIREANELLEKSKQAGKNRITLFDTTVEWEQMPNLINFFLFLNERLNKEKPMINTGFLHKLLKYHEMAKEFLDSEKRNVMGLRYLSLLSYDIGRNIIERDKKSGNIVKGQEECLELQRLMNIEGGKNSLIYNLKIPVFWALYRNRK